jgi:hypothetical protein
MKDQREDIINYLGRALFVVLFFFLVVSFSGQPVKRTCEPAKIQLAAELHPGPVITDAAQLPLFQKNLASCVDKMSFQLFNEAFKRSADDRIITQRFIFLRQTELLIKPSTNCRFYYHRFPKDTGEVPILG